MSGIEVADLIKVARGRSEGTDNTEYVRGQAELIANFVPNDGDVEVYEQAIDLISRLIVVWWRPNRRPISRRLYLATLKWLMT